MKKAVYWKIYFVLITWCIFGVITVFPYILSVQRDIFKTIPVPVHIIFLIQLLQSTIIFSLAILIGLKAAKKTGFSLPFLEAAVSGKPFPSKFRTYIKTPVILGVSAALMIGILDYGFSLMGVGLLMKEYGYIPAWQRFLVAFYGGVNEEVIMRLFLMTVLVWIINKIMKRKNASGPVTWTAIIITSVIFGLGHLPITAAILEITIPVIFRGLLLNSVGGIIFGWLYWKKGLEAAIASHFTADIVLHFLIPLAMGL